METLRIWVKRWERGELENVDGLRGRDYHFSIFGLVVRVAQKRGGVQRRHHQRAVFLKKLAVLPRDLHIGFDDAHGGDAAEADDDFRAD